MVRKNYGHGWYQKIIAKMKERQRKREKEREREEEKERVNESRASTRRMICEDRNSFLCFIQV